MIRRRSVSLLLALVPFSNSQAQEVWATATAQHKDNGRRIIYRYIRSIDASTKQAEFPYRVTVFWGYESESGLPVSPALDAMYELEDKLRDELETAGIAKLVLISTGANLRRWTYYSRSRQDFESGINRVLVPRLKFPIDLEGELDPSWSRLSDFQASVN